VQHDPVDFPVLIHSLTKLSVPYNPKKVTLQHST